MIDESGNHKIEQSLINPEESAEIKTVKLAKEAINPKNIFLYHKTNNRKYYDDIVLDSYGSDDVLFWNHRKEVTETTIANFVARYGKQYFTPPVECGLLPGVYRSKLLESGKIEERILTIDSLKKADEFFLISSVRKWRKIQLLFD
jgi:para-aminobenzoate synthetase/4-amino-4-deoxychorismate lyase